RAPLAANRCAEFPGLGTGQGFGADLAVQLLRAQACRTRGDTARAGKTLWPPVGDGGTAVDRTGFRRGHRAVRNRIRSAVPCRGAAALRRAAGFDRGAGLRAARADFALSLKAPVGFLA